MHSEYLSSVGSSARGAAGARAAWTSPAFALLAFAILASSSGCSAVIVGAVAAIASGFGSKGTSTADAKPQVFVNPTGALFFAGSPDVLEIPYAIDEDDADFVDVRVVVERLVTNNDGDLVPDGPPKRAVPFPDPSGQSGEPVELTCPGEPSMGMRVPRPAPEGLRFLWDVKANFGEDTVAARLTIMPCEGPREGEPGEVTIRRAGNSPVSIRSLGLSNNRDVDAGRNVIFVTFQLVDLESDPVANRPALVGAAFSVDGGASFHEIALDTNDPAAFNSGPEGVSGSFNLDVREVAAVPALAVLDDPGFRGPLAVRIAVKDFSPEAFAGAETSSLFDNNEPPVVEIVSIGAPLPSSGAIPIRYRLFDADIGLAEALLQPADLVVQFQAPGDGEFRTAAEVPFAGSAGRVMLDSLAAERIGDPNAPVRVFVWDAGAQVRDLPAAVLLSVAASDSEPGPRSLATIELDALASLAPSAPIDAGGRVLAVAAADFDGDGITDLAYSRATRVREGDPPATRDRVSFLRGSAEGLLPLGGVDLCLGPSVLAPGDFDGDGVADLLAVSNLSGHVSYLHGGPGGPAMCAGCGCANPETCGCVFFVGSDPHSVAVARFDEDSFADAAVLLGRGRRLRFFRGGPAGIEACGACELEIGAGATGLAGGDFDGDGRRDVVVAFNDGGNGRLMYVLAPGAAPTAAALVDVVLPGAPEAIEAVDLDGDGADEVVVALAQRTEAQEGLVLVVAGGAPPAVSAAPVSVAVDPIAVAAADFDGDGLPEAVVVSRNGREAATIARGPQVTRRVAVGITPSTLAVADVDGDGYPDALVFNQLSNDVTLLRGGPRGLERAGHLAAGDSPAMAAAGDFNGDGAADLAVVGFNADSVLVLSGSSGRLEPGTEEAVAACPLALARGDFDGDRFEDVAVVNSGTALLSFLGGSPSGLRERPERGIVLLSRLTFAPQGVDFNADGFTDLVLVNQSGRVLLYFAGSPQGLVAPAAERIVRVGNGPVAIAVGRFDTDKHFDAAVANQSSRTVSFVRGGVNGIVAPSDGAPAPAVALPGAPRLLLAQDFDHDGTDDLAAGLAAAAGNPHALAVLAGTATGPALEGGFVMPLDARPAAVAAGDFDGDGFADLAVALDTGTSVTIVSGGPQGLDPASRRDVAVPAEVVDPLVVPCNAVLPQRLASADFDGDGFADLAVALETASAAAWMRGGEDGLGAAATLTTGPGPRAVATGDFDGDGFTDAAVLCGGAAVATFLRGGPGGLRRAEDLPVGDGPYAAAPGDFNGDRLADLAVTSERSQTVSFLRQRWFIPHPTHLAPPAAPAPGVTLDDARLPVRFRLEAAPGALSPSQQITVLQAEVFRPAATGGFRAAPVQAGPTIWLGTGSIAFPVEAPSRQSLITDAVRILPEDFTPGAPVRLTLRLRDRNPALLAAALAGGGRLVAYVATPQAPDGERIARPVEITDLDGDPAASFDVPRFGRVIVVLEE